MTRETAGHSAATTSVQPERARAQIVREQAEGMTLIAVTGPSLSEFHLTLQPRTSESALELVRRCADILNAVEATPVRQFCFGNLEASRLAIGAMRQAFDSLDLPLTWIEGRSCHGDVLAGLQVQAIAGADVRPLPLGGASPARIWRDGVATHCVLSALGPHRRNLPARDQTRETLEHLQSELVQAGLTMKHLARTWFFLDDILGWYGEFNEVRNAFFEQCELRPGSLPASTGVRGRNPLDAALTAAAWAIKPHQETAPLVHFVPSPRQCAATVYGSAFSRAVEMDLGSHRHLSISGTASIEPGGKTAHVGDLRGQIELTMRVVRDILESRGLGFGDVSRATAYFKAAAGLPSFEEWLGKNGLTGLPVVSTCCEICRDDLLFEIELDAIAA